MLVISPKQAQPRHLGWSFLLFTSSPVICDRNLYQRVQWYITRHVYVAYVPFNPVWLYWNIGFHNHNLISRQIRRFLTNLRAVMLSTLKIWCGIGIGCRYAREMYGFWRFCQLKGSCTDMMSAEIFGILDPLSIPNQYNLPSYRHCWRYL